MAEIPRPAWLGPARLGIGLAQGLALYGQTEAAPAVVGGLSALQLVLALGPLPVLEALGRMRPRLLLPWAVLAAAVVAGLGLHAQYAGSRTAALAVLLVAPSLFVAHVLVVAAALAGRPRAPYPVYFDQAWSISTRPGRSACNWRWRGCSSVCSGAC